MSPEEQVKSVSTRGTSLTMGCQGSIVGSFSEPAYHSSGIVRTLAHYLESYKALYCKENYLSIFLEH